MCARQLTCRLPAKAVAMAGTLAASSGHFALSVCVLAASWLHD
jgi:hypothetical protein